MINAGVCLDENQYRWVGFDCGSVTLHLPSHLKVSGSGIVSPGDLGTTFVYNIYGKKQFWSTRVVANVSFFR